MAQHYKLTEEKEPKIFKSVRRIMDYHIRASKFITRYKKNFNKEFIYRKEVMKLPDDFKMDEKTKLVLSIGKYDLQNSEWWKGIDGQADYDLKQMHSNLTLECHINNVSKITIYVVM